MLATTQAGCLIGIDAAPVQVEVRIGQGLPGIDIVGLPERGVRESRVRVQAALDAIGFSFPPRHLVINLAPGDVRKTGASFDLAIAIALMAACGAVPITWLESTVWVGELGLAGGLRPVRGVLAQLRSAIALGLKAAIVPAANADEAALVDGIDVRVADNIGEVVEAMSGGAELSTAKQRASGCGFVRDESLADLSTIYGQGTARRVLEIAAAGEHHLLMSGPPGSGKTQLARCLPTILPQPTSEEALAICTIATAAGEKPPTSNNIQRPFRAPHHTASAQSLIGGGEPVRPGEVTLAHGGVLFLDELPEFHRDAIESLRTTMESGLVCITRARERVTMPAAPLIVAAMNPCPCGFDGDSKHICRCGAHIIANYRRRVSGPLLDRFDLQIQVPRLSTRAIRHQQPGESSADVRERVIKARALLAEHPVDFSLEALPNVAMPEAVRFLEMSSDKLGLSIRGYLKTLKIARTIAALQGQIRVSELHIAEALQYRLRTDELRNVSLSRRRVDSTSTEGK